MFIEDQAIRQNEITPIETTAALSDDLRRYLALVWHWAWLITLIVVAATAVGYYMSSRQTPVYKSSATMLINESRNINEYANILASERLAQTYSQLMIQKPVMEGVIDRLGLTMSPGSLKSRVSVNVVRDTQLMVVSVEDTNPERAANIANTIGIIFSEQNKATQASRYAESKDSLSTQLDQVDTQIQETNLSLASLESKIAIRQIEAQAEAGGEVEILTASLLTPEEQRERERLQASQALYQQIYANLLQSFEQVRLAEIQNTSSVELVEPAEAASSPIRPNVLQDTSLAAAIGILFGVGLVFLIEVLNDTVKGPDDITRHLRLPVLGLIAQFNDQEGGPIAFQEPRSPLTEAFRALRTNIQYASVDEPILTLLVTSPSPKDGKSTVAANLSVVMAQSGRDVALIDADLRRPSIHKQLQIRNRRGLTDLFVQSEIYLDGTLRETDIPGLKVMSSGTTPPNPSELIGSGKMTEVLNQVQKRVDLIVIDTPPVMAVTDAAILAPQVDGVLLVVRPGQTKLAAAKQTVEQLRRGGANLLGIVLNDVENKRSRYYYYYKGYYAYYSYYGSSESDETDAPYRKEKRQSFLKKKRKERNFLKGILPVRPASSTRKQGDKPEKKLQTSLKSEVNGTTEPVQDPIFSDMSSLWGVEPLESPPELDKEE